MSRRLSPLAVVFLTVFIDLVGFGIVIPLVPLYAEAYKPTPLAFGILMASFSAMQFLFAPLLGRLSDRIGRRPVLLFSLFGSFLSYLLFAFAGSFAAPPRLARSWPGSWAPTSARRRRSSPT